MKNKRTLTLFFIWLLVNLSFCTVHLTNDFYCFITWARLTSLTGVDSIASLSEVWELKGVLLRFIFLVQYSISSWFANDVALEFQFIYHLLGAIWLNGIIALAVYFFPSKYIGKNINRKDLFFLSGTILFAVHFASHLQAEFIAVPILMLATSLYLRDNVYLKLLSGFLVGMTFFLKSPIPIMGGSLMFIAMLYKRNSFIKEVISILPLAISMLCTIAICLFILNRYAPQEIQDMLSASVYQNTLLSNPTAIKRSIFSLSFFLSRNVWYNYGIGILLLILGYYLAQSRDKHAFTYILIATLFPCAYIMISNCYFEYHGYLLMYPAVFSIWYYLSNNHITHISKDVMRFYFSVIIIALIINPWAYYIPSSALFWSGLTVVICCLSLIKKIHIPICRIFVALLVFSYIINGSSISASAIRSNIEYNEYLCETKIQDIEIGKPLGEKSILFLDAGHGSFFIPNESYLRYFYPLPIQRINEEISPFVNSDIYKSTIDDILAYDNDYIIVSSWFFHYPHERIEQFIADNYYVAQEAYLPSWSWKLFCYNQMELIKIQIYKRRT